jgi:ADP-ribose pyrophosphatase YjhB (NUDIX family)
MRPNDHFLHCPRCGRKQAHAPPPHAFSCDACGFTLYFSASNSATVFVERHNHDVLLIRRAQEPARGRLAPPGGFIDIGETAESAARREVREEVGLEVVDLRFLCSHPNSYLFKDVTYPVLDFFFTARAIHAERAQALDDVDSVCWMRPEYVDPAELAFPSMRVALARLVEQRALSAGMRGQS